MEAPNKYFCTRCEQEFKHLSGILRHQKSKKHETTCQKTLHSHMCSCGKQFQGIEAFELHIRVCDLVEEDAYEDVMKTEREYVETSKQIRQDEEIYDRNPRSSLFEEIFDENKSSSYCNNVTIDGRIPNVQEWVEFAQDLQNCVYTDPVDKPSRKTVEEFYRCMNHVTFRLNVACDDGVPCLSDEDIDHWVGTISKTIPPGTDNAFFEVYYYDRLYMIICEMHNLTVGTDLTKWIKDSEESTVENDTQEQTEISE